MGSFFNVHCTFLFPLLWKAKRGRAASLRLSKNKKKWKMEKMWKGRKTKNYEKRKNELGQIVAHCGDSAEGRRGNNAKMATRGKKQMRMHLYVSVCTHVFICICLYACIYIYLFLYIYLLPFKRNPLDKKNKASLKRKNKVAHVLM